MIELGFEQAANPPDLLGIDLRGALLAVERRRVGHERESVLGEGRARPNAIRIPDRSAFIAPVDVASSTASTIRRRSQI